MPLLVGIIWGTLVSSGTSIPVRGFGRLALEIAIFGLASAGQLGSGRVNLGLVLAILFLSNES